MEVRPYKDGDVMKRDDWRGQVNKHFINLWCQAVPAVTILIDDEIICILMASLINETVGQVNVVMSDDISKEPRWVSEQVAEALQFFMAYYKLTRVYTLVDGGSDRDKKWIERLGFVQSYVMPEAGSNGSDMIGYTASQIKGD